MHYVPQWVKTDTKRFPRVVRADGEPIDVLTPISKASLEADKAAFTALMRHLKGLDDSDHTVLMVQVENEAGNIGSVRDFSPEANALFAKAVPSDLLAAAQKPGGTWKEAFGNDADEIFQLYHQGRYINEIAEAGKHEFAIPVYMNVWLSYPPGELPERRFALPGIQYPSGGAVQKYVGLWRKLAPAIDFIAPDIYSDDAGFVNEVLAAYARPDNALSVPEVAKGDSFASYVFSALGAARSASRRSESTGAAGTSWGSAVLATRAQLRIARAGCVGDRRLNFEGRLKTAVEGGGQPQQELDFGDWQATVSFGFPRMTAGGRRGRRTSTARPSSPRSGPTSSRHGRGRQRQLPCPGGLPGLRMQILSAEEVTYKDGAWVTSRLWNGDETDRGLQFPQTTSRSSA
jgi:hypothetical protein